MTQDELWLRKYNEVMGFMETNLRNLSKYRKVIMSQIISIHQDFYK